MEDAKVLLEEEEEERERGREEKLLMTRYSETVMVKGVRKWCGKHQ
jgi:hypothetical protein